MFFEAGVVAKSDVVYDLRDEDEISEHDHPLVVTEEVGECEIQEQPEV